MVTAVRVVRVHEAILSAQGVFIEIGYTPNSEFIDIVEKNNFGEIKVNARCETNVPYSQLEM
jgi:alkyl hydroperoxide reductase subunit AhpF